MKMRWRWICAVLVLLAGVVHAQSFTRDVGGRTVSMPTPPGYVRVSEADPYVFQLMDTTTPHSKRLIEALVTQADLSRMRVGEIAKDHMFLVYEDLKWAGREPTRQEWRAEREKFLRMARNVDVSKAVGTMEEMLNESADAKLETPIRFDIGAIGQPVMYRADERSVRFFTRVSVGASANDRKIAADLLIFAASAPLNRRMVTFNGMCACADEDERARTLMVAFDDLIDRAIADNEPTSQ